MNHSTKASILKKRPLSRETCGLEAGGLSLNEQHVPHSPPESDCKILAAETERFSLLACVFVPFIPQLELTQKQEFWSGVLAGETAVAGTQACRVSPVACDGSLTDCCALLFHSWDLPPAVRASQSQD